MRAVIAGTGALPAHLAGLSDPPLICPLEGFAPTLPNGVETHPFRLEQLGTLLNELESRGVRDVCFAGAMARVPVDPSRIDAATLPLVPRIMAALQSGGDDAALRAAAALFEERGFTLHGAHEWAPDLLPPEGVLSGALTPDLEASAAQAMALLDQLSPADLGQGCVLLGTRVMAVEATPGTDWMLGSLAGGAARGGLFAKAPKAGQDRRFDLPAIGPHTIDGATKAGLSAIVIQAGGVMMLERSRTIAAAEDAGITLWVRP